jgi:hypothetical protein
MQTDENPGMGVAQIFESHRAKINLINNFKKTSHLKEQLYFHRKFLRNETN